MKKILSIFLSVLLIVTLICSTTVISNAMVHKYELSKEELITFPAEKHQWLKVDESVSHESGTLRFPNNDGRVEVSQGGIATMPIIETYNGLKETSYNSDLTDFEWSFEYAINSNAASSSRLFFMFHVNENSKYGTDLVQYDSNITTAGLDNASNFFAVVYNGKSLNASSDGIAKGGFTVLQTTKVGDGYAMRPLKYTETDGVITPDASSYISFADNYNTNSAIASFSKITMTLVGRHLTITLVPGTGNNNWTGELSKTFILSEEAMTAAPSGDFVMAQSTFYENTAIFKCRDMDIKNVSMPDEGLIFDTTELDAYFAEQEGLGEKTSWFSFSNGQYDDIYRTAHDALILKNEYCMNPLLETNGYDDANITDFVWQFEYKPNDTNSRQLTTLLFHIDEERENSPTDLPSTTENIRGQVKNALGITLSGTQIKEETANFWLNSIKAEYASGTTFYGMPTYKYVYEGADTEATEDDKSVNKPYSYVNFKSYDVTNGIATNSMVRDWYTIRVSLKGNMLIVNMWQTGYKNETMSTLYHEFTEAQMSACPSGDFAILNTGYAGLFKNMKIYRGTDIILNTDDYSEYNDYLTEYSFDSDVADIVIEDETTGSVSHDDTEKALKIGTESGKTAIIRSFDGGNNNLGDFIAQYDWSENHQWTNASIHFRKQDDKNYYRIRFYKNSTTASQKNDRYYISLYKYVNGVETELAVAPMSKSITAGQKYSIVLKAIEDKIELYFAQQGTVIDTPIISVSDDSYTTGEFWYTHYNGGAYFYDMKIYDLTAKAFADDVNDFNVDEIVRADRTEVKALSNAYSLLHTAQQTKAGVISAKTTLDGNVATIAELEAIAMDVNVTDGVDIRDLVALSKHLSDNTFEINETADPAFDGVIDSLDMVALRKYLLGVAHY